MIISRCLVGVSQLNQIGNIILQSLMLLCWVPALATPRKLFISQGFADRHQRLHAVITRCVAEWSHGRPANECWTLFDSKVAFQERKRQSGCARSTKCLALVNPNEKDQFGAARHIFDAQQLFTFLSNWTGLCLVCLWLLKLCDPLCREHA